MYYFCAFTLFVAVVKVQLVALVDLCLVVGCIADELAEFFPQWGCASFCMVCVFMEVASTPPLEVVHQW
jgi:hypothetical protein